MKGVVGARALSLIFLIPADGAGAVSGIGLSSSLWAAKSRFLEVGVESRGGRSFLGFRGAFAGLATASGCGRTGAVAVLGVPEPNLSVSFGVLVEGVATG